MLKLFFIQNFVLYFMLINVLIEYIFAGNKEENARMKNDWMFPPRIKILGGFIIS